MTISDAIDPYRIAINENILEIPDDFGAALPHWRLSPQLRS